MQQSQNTMKFKRADIIAFFCLAAVRIGLYFGLYIFLATGAMEIPFPFLYLIVAVIFPIIYFPECKILSYFHIDSANPFGNALLIFEASLLIIVVSLLLSAVTVAFFASYRCDID